MRVTMLATITGTRDGQEWPAIGESMDLPDAEAVDMLNAGLVSPAGESVETATATPTEQATTRRRGRRKD